MPQAAITERSPHSLPYKRHRPEQTLLYQRAALSGVQGCDGHAGQVLATACATAIL